MKFVSFTLFCALFVSIVSVAFAQSRRNRRRSRRSCVPDQFSVDFPGSVRSERCKEYRKLFYGAEERVCFTGKVTTVPTDPFCSYESESPISFWSDICDFVEPALDCGFPGTVTMRNLLCNPFNTAIVYRVEDEQTETLSFVVMTESNPLRRNETVLEDTPIPILPSDTVPPELGLPRPGWKWNRRSPPFTYPDDPPSSCGLVGPLRKPQNAKVTIRSAKDSREAIITKAKRTLISRGLGWKTVFSKDLVSFEVQRIGGRLYVVAVNFKHLKVQFIEELPDFEDN